jgi:hypothetical protein
LINNGYFILKDGTKSSDFIKKVKKPKKQILSQATKEET